MSRDVLDLLTATNPTPDVTPLADEVWSSEVLREIVDQRRTGANVDPRLSRRNLPTQTRIPRPVLAVATGIAIVILDVGLPLLFGWRNTEEPVVTATMAPPQPTTVPISPPTTAARPTTTTVLTTTTSLAIPPEAANVELVSGVSSEELSTLVQFAQLYESGDAAACIGSHVALSSPWTRFESLIRFDSAIGSDVELMRCAKI